MNSKAPAAWPSPHVAEIVAREVAQLLAASPSYAQLPPTERHDIARDTAKVVSYLADQNAPGLAIQDNRKPTSEHDRPFDTLLDSVDFPQFVAGLIKGVFQAIVESSIQQMDAYANLISEIAKTVDEFLSDDGSCEAHRAKLAERYPGIDPPLASVARLKLATSRQQLLATIVMLGIQRIVTR